MCTVGQLHEVQLKLENAQQQVSILQLEKQEYEKEVPVIM